MKRRLNLHFKCKNKKCGKDWWTEFGLAILYSVNYQSRKGIEQRFNYNAVVEQIKCPECQTYAKAKSVNQNDLNKIAVSFAVEIVRKNLSALNRFADDSSQYTDFNKIIESTVLDLDQL